MKKQSNTAILTPINPGTTSDYPTQIGTKSLNRGTMSSTFTLVNDDDVTSSKFAKFSQASGYKPQKVVPSIDGIYKAVAMPNSTHSKHIAIMKTDSQRSSTMLNIK